MSARRSDPWLTRGWQRFPADAATTAWAKAAADAALPAAAALGPDAVRHGGTWFAGVDHLDNDAEGRIGASGPLRGLCAALAEAEAVTGPLPLHRAQVSITYPGYPRADGLESEGAARYRRHRDAAHLDGLLPVGAARRRHLREPHGFILGIALTGAAPDAAPLVVYDGSVEIIRAALEAVLAPVAPQDWPEVDLTEPYHAARRRVFDSCKRVTVPLAFGESVLVHRLALHGIAPWDTEAVAADAGRAIAYLRPELPKISDWLTLP